MERATPKILHLSTVASARNGVGQIVQAIHEGAHTHGFRSLVVAGYGAENDSDYVLQDKINYLYNVVRSRLWDVDGFLSGRNTERIIDIVGKEKPDIVHIHNLHGYYIDSFKLIRFLKSQKIPIVFTAHDLWMATGRCAFPPSQGCECLQKHFCKKCPHKQNYPANLLKTNFSKLVRLKRELFKDAFIVVPTQWMKEKLKQFDKVKVIANGVNFNVFNSENEEVQTKERKNILAVATRWDSRKGHDRLLELAERLPDEYYITAVGKGAPRHPKIKRLGYVWDSKALASIMRDCFAMISFSTQESFGMAVAEGLACGLPVITDRRSASSELVCEPKLIIDTCSFEEIINALKYIERERPEVHGNIISIDEMTDKYYLLYERLLADKEL